MSESDEFTIDVKPEGDGFVGVVRQSGEDIWSGPVRATKREALRDAQLQRALMLARAQAAQDDRDSKKVTMDIAAEAVQQSWGYTQPSREDDGVLGL